VLAAPLLIERLLDQSEEAPPLEAIAQIFAGAVELVIRTPELACALLDAKVGNVRAG